MLPHLLSASLVKNSEKKTVCILVATSGDTGKAALEGFKDVKGTKILVFYPKDGVSEVQSLADGRPRRAATWACAPSIGNFDDAQTGVKTLFSDERPAGRSGKAGLLPVLCQLHQLGPGPAADGLLHLRLLRPAEPGQDPDGREGQLLRAHRQLRQYPGLPATPGQMGLPVGKLICASNSNNVLTDFLATGTYDRNRPFYTTMSPSMDILVSSNLERLLFALSGQDDKLVADYMQQLNKHGSYTVSDEIKAKLKSDFYGGFCSEEETSKVIAEVWKKYNYLIDPHTAVAYDVMEKYRQETGDTNKTVFVSTASPFKFCDSVLHSLGVAEVQDGIDALDQLSQTTNRPAPVPLASLRNKAVRFTESVDKEKMEDVVLEMLK